MIPRVLANQRPLEGHSNDFHRASQDYIRTRTSAGPRGQRWLDVPTLNSNCLRRTGEIPMRDASRLSKGGLK